MIPTVKAMCGDGRKEERIRLEVVRRRAAYSFDLDLAVATVSWQTVGK
jgi:hypothetical protein